MEHSLATDLVNAGLVVVLDRWENARIGSSVDSRGREEKRSAVGFGPHGVGTNSVTRFAFSLVQTTLFELALRALYRLN